MSPYFKYSTVTAAVKASPAAEKERVRKSAFAPSGEKSGLFEALRSLRYKLAQEEGVPAYIIFSNAHLADMARKAPGTIAEFMDVSGVGEVKAARYGKVFLDAIAEFEGGGND